jgi:uncharacterized protein YegP (UPF0339 family)
MSGIFEVFVDDAGKYRFQLRSSTGEIIALSDAYASRSGVEAAIESVRHTALTAFVDDRTRPPDRLTLPPSLDGD